MRIRRSVRNVVVAAVLALPGAVLVAQAARPVTPIAVPAALNEKDVAATQSELVKLLKLSPTLTTVVARDPSLLSNQEYVARNNPQLAQFLAQHPEVARNPEYFLFSHLHAEGQPDEALERAVWPALVPERRIDSNISYITGPFFAVLGFACFLGAVVWLTRSFIENRRWNRVFKLQSEVHGRLIDKFSSAQELGAYMETDAGRKFLEASPIAVNAEPERRVPQVVGRVLTGVQAGIVMVLLGTGCMLLRHVSADTERPMLVIGTLVLMPGVGFIISAGVTWLLAARLGLMPEGLQTGLATKTDRQ
jgi:hypothetical protein